jgi:hypothetical protein
MCVGWLLAIRPRVENWRSGGIKEFYTDDKIRWLARTLFA